LKDIVKRDGYVTVEQFTYIHESRTSMNFWASFSYHILVASANLAHTAVLFTCSFLLYLSICFFSETHTHRHFWNLRVTIYCLRSTKTRRGEIAFVCVALFVLERLHWSFQKLFIIIQSYPSSSLIYFLWSTDKCRVWHRPL
jgi:hypothetical protein